MTTHDPATVLAEMQARCDARAVERVTWEAYPLFDSDTERRKAFRRGVAWAMAVSGSSLTIAALQGVLGLHVKATRWGDDDGEYSLDQADYDDSPEDYTHLRPFDVCAECFRIEQSPEIHDNEMPHAILEGLWPCPTVRTITEALKGES